MLPKDVRCYFALAKRLLAEVDFSALSQETRSQYSALAKEAISEVLEARPNARIGTVVRIATDQIQDEVGELVAQDEDRQAVDKIVEAAMDKFLANSDLFGADAETGDRIAGVIWDHMEAVAKDWCPQSSYSTVPGALPRDVQSSAPCEKAARSRWAFRSRNPDPGDSHATVVSSFWAGSVRAPHGLQQAVRPAYRTA